MPISIETLRHSALERIVFFEKQLLSEYGIRVRTGAELEFIPLNEQGLPQANLLDEAALTKGLRNSIPNIERVHRESDFSQVQYEFVSGPNSSIAGTGLRDASPSSTAETVVAFKDAISANAKDWGMGGVSFTPRLPVDNGNAHNGFHLNLSLWDGDGQKNLFYEKGKNTTDLQRHVMDAMIHTHGEGTVGYVPYSNSFDRINTTNTNEISTNTIANIFTTVPNSAGHVPNKGIDVGTWANGVMDMVLNKPFTIGSIASRHGSSNPFNLTMSLGEYVAFGSVRSSLIGWEKPHQYRLESRLAGADADPYVVTAMEMASIYDAAKNHLRPYDASKPINKKTEQLLNIGDRQFVVDKHNGKFASTPLPKSIEEARDSLAQSDRLRVLLGEDLYHGIIAYSDPLNHPDRASAAPKRDHKTNPKSEAIYAESAEYVKTHAIIPDYKTGITTTINDSFQNLPSPIRPKSERGKLSLTTEIVQTVERIGHASSFVATESINGASHTINKILSHPATAKVSAASGGVGVGLGVYGLSEKLGKNGTYNKDVETHEILTKSGVAADVGAIGAGAVSALKNVRGVGPVGAALGVVSGGIETTIAVKDKDGHRAATAVGATTGGLAGGIAAGLAGAKVGAVAGSAIGVWFGGVGAIPAAAIGSIIGGLIGSTAGAFGGSLIGGKTSNAIAGDAMHEYLNKDLQPQQKLGATVDTLKGADVTNITKSLKTQNVSLFTYGNNYSSQPIVISTKNPSSGKFH